MKIKQKLSAIILVPLVILIIFTIVVSNTKIHEFKMEAEIVELIELSTKLSSFVHEAQKERGATAVFIGSQGTKFQSELSSQRISTMTTRSCVAVFLRKRSLLPLVVLERQRSCYALRKDTKLAARKVCH